MKCNRMFSRIVYVVIFVFLAVNSAYATNWTVTQLTNNNYADWDPQVYGSNVVWQGFDGNDDEIFLYDGNSTTQLTNNSYDDSWPVHIYGSNVVWQGYDGSDWEIFLAWISGDFNGDSNVDAFDFADWQANYPTASGATRAMGDADGDGDVDAYDFADWQANYPYSFPPEPVSTPEPATLTLLAAGLLLLLKKGRCSYV